MGVYTHQLYANVLYINEMQKTLRFHITKVARLKTPMDFL
jgi:hypothetical protein